MRARAMFKHLANFGLGAHLEKPGLSATDCVEIEANVMILHSDEIDDDSDDQGE